MWQQIKALYVSGVTLGQIARQTGVPKGTLCARAKREEWTREKNDTLALKEQVAPIDRATTVASVVAEHRLATLLSGAKTAETLAKRAEEASKDVPVKTLEDVQQVQNYRQGLWPSSGLITPQQQADVRAGKRLVISSEVKAYVRASLQQM